MLHYNLEDVDIEELEVGDIILVEELDYLYNLDKPAITNMVNTKRYVVLRMLCATWPATLIDVTLLHVSTGSIDTFSYLPYEGVTRLGTSTQNEIQLYNALYL